MITPRQYQIEGVDRIAELYQKGIRRIVRQLPTGAGKCLAKGTPILMFDGSIKAVEDVKVGDQIMGSDSKVRNVLSLANGKEMMYKVTPVKGKPYVVNESHILSLRITGTNPKEYTVYNGERYYSGEIVNIPIVDYLKQSKTFKHLAKGYRVSIDFDSREIDFDPYILGLWLAEGTHNQPCISNPEQEIIEAFGNYVQSIGCGCRIQFDHDKCTQIHAVGTNDRGCKGGGNNFTDYLRKYNLISNKHIPELYKVNDRSIRLKILAGLLDGDGHLHHNVYEILTKYKQLNDDILYLCRSLGYGAYSKYTYKENTTTGKGGYYHRITISGDMEEIPCILERKQAVKRTQVKNVLNVGIKVEPIGIDQYYGFTIDGDHLFVLGDFTVTHNTIEFAMLTSRFISKMNSNVVILVNREVLLKQTVDTLSKHFGIKADGIIAGAREGGRKQVKVAMVETGFNRIQKNRDFFGKVGLLIVDEAHYGEFKKMYPHFAGALIVAVTATPLYSTKKDPMKNYFDEIVTGPNISEMIELGSLMPNETHTLAGINTKKFGVKNGEFDQKQMGDTYSTSKHIVNCVKAYEKFCKGEKTIVFNCNIDHSKKVTQAFIDAGYNARHLDGTESKEQTAATLRWFKNTQDAVLCNIMKLTAGFDEPSIINVILNYSTLSLTKYLQSTGRGSRPYLGKSFFRIIDMGGNYDLHGDWRDDRDWYDLFHNPEKPKDSAGVAPIKTCQQCFAMIPAQAVVCKECGFVHERTTKYDTVKLEFIKVVEAININKIIEDTSHAKEWQAYFIMEGVALTMLKRKMDGEEITPDIAAMAFEDFTPNIKKWRSLMPRKDGLGRPYLDDYGQPLVGMPMTKNIIQFAWKSFHEKIEKYNESILKKVG